MILSELNMNQMDGNQTMFVALVVLELVAKVI